MRDAGSSYTWIRAAFGPAAGAYGAWVLLVANMFAVLATALPAGTYTLDLVAPALAANALAVALVACALDRRDGAALVVRAAPDGAAGARAAGGRGRRARRRGVARGRASAARRRRVRAAPAAPGAGVVGGDRDRHLDDRRLGSLGLDGRGGRRRRLRARLGRARRPDPHQRGAAGRGGRVRAHRQRRRFRRARGRRAGLRRRPARRRVAPGAVGDGAGLARRLAADDAGLPDAQRLRDGPRRRCCRALLGELDRRAEPAAVDRADRRALAGLRARRRPLADREGRVRVRPEGDVVVSRACCS